MNKYIFITEEGYTYQPNSDSIEPDIENLQVVGFGQGKTARNALDNLIEHNKFLPETNFDVITAIQIKNDIREQYSLKELGITSNIHA